MTSETEIPTQFSHSIKLEETAKGIRISVHVYANSLTQSVEQAFEMYSLARAEAVSRDIELAPIEIKERKT